MRYTTHNTASKAGSTAHQNTMRRSPAKLYRRTMAAHWPMKAPTVSDEWLAPADAIRHLTCKDFGDRSGRFSNTVDEADQPQRPHRARQWAVPDQRFVRRAVANCNSLGAPDCTFVGPRFPMKVQAGSDWLASAHGTAVHGLLFALAPILLPPWRELAQCRARFVQNRSLPVATKHRVCVCAARPRALRATSNPVRNWRRKRS